jgi:Mg2+ and Co2+ transporter CorA
MRNEIRKMLKGMVVTKDEIVEGIDYIDIDDVMGVIDDIESEVGDIENNISKLKEKLY